MLYISIDPQGTRGREGAIEPNRHRTAGRLRRLALQLGVLRKRLALGQRLRGGVLQGVLSAAAALMAYLPTQALGLREGFWAAITAIAVVQTEYSATRNTARDQFTGAAIGGVIGVAVMLSAGSHLISYAASVVVSMMVCWMANVGSAARLAGITATIIMLVPHQDSPEAMMLSRVSEVGWGVAVAVALVWLASRIEPAQSGDRPKPS